MIAHGQEYSFMQHYSTISVRNPAFTGIIQEPVITGQFKWEGEAHPQRYSSETKTYMIGYEQPLKNKAGSLGFRLLTDDRRTNIGTSHNQQLHLQYANAIKRKKTSLLYGLRAGLSNQTFNSSRSTIPDGKSGIELYSSLGAAVCDKNMYFGIGILNFANSGYFTYADQFDMASPVLVLQSAGFIEVNPDNPKILLVPSLDLDVIFDENVQGSMRLNVVSPHVSGGAAVVAEDDGLLVEVNFSFIGKNFRAGYSLACPAGADSFSSSDYLNFKLHLAYFLPRSKDTDQSNIAYCFRRLL
jgi:hypothetical protein